MKLPDGKIPIDILKQVIFKNLGAERKEVALGPSAGIDGAVLDIGNHSLVISMDPITGALERIGWLALNINANDIATFGVKPAFIVSCIMLPEGSDRKTVETISIQMDKASKNLGIAIVGGHCEVTPGLTNPIVVCCVMGLTEKGNYITAGGARPEDRLILTKSAGIEGTAILASDREKQLKKAMSPKMLQSAKKFFEQTSVVKEAIEAYKTGGVNAMHDPTEGGIVGGVYEMAEASNLGVKILEDKIRVQPETAEICKFFNINPLQLISSGALLIAAKPKTTDTIIKNLRAKNIPAIVIGEFLEDPADRVLIKKSGKTSILPRPAPDHLWAALNQR